MAMSNSGDLQAGLTVMCLCLLVPFSVGALAGWLLKGRAINLGLPWAFLPGFIKRLWEIVTRD
jgi:hypothetical protein